MSIFRLILILSICFSDSFGKRYESWFYHISGGNSFDSQFGVGKKIDFTNGFYSKGNGFSFTLLSDDGNYPISYEGLVPGLFQIFSNFSDVNPERELSWIDFNYFTFFNLINGSLGYEGNWVSIELHNQFLLFFTRYGYHQSGISLGFGKKKIISLYVFERDRFDRGFESINFGLRYSVFD